MKTNPPQHDNGTPAVRRVRVKGKHMVMLEEAAYEALLRKADLGEPALPAPDADGNYPALAALAVIQARDILRTAARPACRKPNWPGAPASARKRSTASNRAGTNQACRSSPRLTGR